eukprot:6976991-Alexandrium_andersonii.AAC.1
MEGRPSAARPRKDADAQNLAMSDQDLRLRLERAASPHAAWAALIAGSRLIRGSALGLLSVLGVGE